MLYIYQVILTGGEEFPFEPAEDGKRKVRLFLSFKEANSWGKIIGGKKYAVRRLQVNSRVFTDFLNGINIERSTSAANLTNKQEEAVRLNKASLSNTAHQPVGPRSRNETHRIFGSRK